MTVNEIINILSNSLKQYPVKKAYLFGSFARQEQKPDSDIDLLIEFNKKVSLFDILRIEKNLGNSLERKIDIVEYNAVKPGLKEYIYKDLLTII